MGFAVGVVVGALGIVLIEIIIAVITAEREGVKKDGDF